MKRLVLNMAVVAAIMAPAAVSAQDKVEASISADVVSNYIWRGQDLGSAAVQPTLGVSYAGFSLSAWGSYGLATDATTKEIDFTLSYTVGGLTIGVTDYYCTYGSSTTPGRYFEYAAHSTSHVYEANVGYDFGCMSLNWFTNFAGSDYCKPSDGSRAYSSYFEVAAPFKLGGCDWEAALGIVPFETAFYADASGFAVANISLKATKELEITPTFKLPVFAGLAANPSTEKLYFTAGFTVGL
ncbi:MAG: hypothetical protein K6E54_04615 [Bacteroidaceae bacterium]|nr:hypothetical protein [Bacteroidaceae bacterium]